VQKAALVEKHSSQWQQHHSHKQPAVNNPSINPSSILNQSFINPQPIKKPPSFFRESFTSSGKQGGGATVLGEGRDFVTRET
jgi:hypothetical protein